MIGRKVTAILNCELQIGGFCFFTEFHCAGTATNKAALSSFLYPLKYQLERRSIFLVLLLLLLLCNAQTIPDSKTLCKGDFCPRQNVLIISKLNRF